jgi:tetratricopeptide (TPR) repeat protein/O-antigen ligase
LLRTIALVIIATWIVKLIEQSGLQWDTIPRGETWYKTIFGIPLLAPVVALALIYIISTIFSVNPRVSLWGSYQRMQGTYTTISYLVVFASMLANLRRRAQVERLIGAVIISSLPVSLYGVLQRFGIDPIPWGGDVTARIASNMGNSIFVAAYLIMVSPLTLMRIVDSFEALLKDRGAMGPNFARATGYVFIAALQIIAIYFSGSRGPWLGWGLSLVFIWLGLSLIWRARWLTISGVVLALIAGAFLITLNIPNGPLESLRSRPEFGRLGQLLDAESRTGRVRTLIWSGASELVRPHEPIEYPDGRQDPFNLLRPLIGYGPESMYVAYNRFYPPELTQVEKRNASPDRSHNETWDSLVITGVLGLIIYLTLFGLVIYYGLKWLGLVDGKRQRYLFLGLYLLGGAASSIFFVLWQGVAFLGVALPFGMIVGVVIYLILISLFGEFQTPHSQERKLQAYLLLGFLSAVMAHFVEINFGIAIVATRTYFWSYAALLVLVGWVFPLHGQFTDSLEENLNEQEQGALEPASQKRRDSQRKRNEGAIKKKRREGRTGTKTSQIEITGWLLEAVIIGLIVAVLLTTLGYDFISNAGRSKSASEILWSSFTRLGNSGGQPSNGVLALILTSWLFGVILLASESVQFLDGSLKEQVYSWGKIIGVSLGISILLPLVFWIWHAEGLASLARYAPQTLDDVLQQVQQSEGILTSYYVYLFLLLFGLAVVLPKSWPKKSTRFQAISIGVSFASFVIAFGIASYTNLRVIQADIAYKTADLFSKSNSWPVAIAIYNHANDLAPAEDFYYLFLGRAYLEQAKQLENPVEREGLISQAAQDLQRAQEINPLNTDHTANLARLYSLWSSYTENPEQKERLAQASDNYFSRAVTLSPNNARIWNEWAVLDINILNTPEDAYEKLERALELDPYYDWTYGILGDYFLRYVGGTAEPQSAEKENALIQAAEYYTQALKYAGSSNNALKYSYAISLASIYSELGDVELAIEAYEQSLELNPTTPDRWKIELALARLYAVSGDMTKTIEYAQAALSSAPEDQKQAVVDFLTQLGIQQ